MKRWAAFCMLFWQASLLAGELTLINDSPFPLRAVILSGSGKNLGEVPLEPQEQTNWSDGWGGSSSSQTPYTVQWMCGKGEEVFGVCINIAEGGMVSSKDCPGNNTCPVEQPQQNADSSSSQ